MKQALYGLHRDRDDKVLGAGSFTSAYQMGDWIKSLDLRDGDFVEFHEVTARAEFDEVAVAPPLTPPAADPIPVPATADDQPL